MQFNIRKESVYKMKISKITTNYQTKNEQLLNNNQQTSTTNRNSHVNFKSFSGLMLSVAKYGANSLKQSQKLQYVRNLEDLFVKNYRHSAYDIIDKKEAFINAYAALAKTNDDFWDGKHNSISALLADVVFNYGYSTTLPISSIRDAALTKMPDFDFLGIIDDYNTEHVQIRKDFLRSWFSNNHEITESFQKVFTLLDDSIYSSFKEEIINTCLYSRSYNANRDYYTKKKNDSILINSLDETIYSALLRKIKY